MHDNTVKKTTSSSLFISSPLVLLDDQFSSVTRYFYPYQIFIAGRVWFDLWKIWIKNFGSGLKRRNLIPFVSNHYVDLRRP